MAIPFIPYLMKEITTKCAFAYTDKDFKDTVDAFLAGRNISRIFSPRLTAIPGRFKGIETMVTSRIHLDDIAEKGFEELVQHKDNHIKIMVSPNRSSV
jgi:threonine dehydrogenase-like Zn-dependent dehydrogenase